MPSVREENHEMKGPTPEERAEKLAGCLCERKGQPPSKHRDWCPARWCPPHGIAAQIRAAENAALERAAGACEKRTIWTTVPAANALTDAAAAIRQLKENPDGQ